MIEKEALINRLKDYGQEHLLKFWEELNDYQREDLYEDIQRLDVAELTECYKNVKADLNKTVQALDESLMKPIPYEQRGSVVGSSDEQLRHYENEGMRAIANNEVAVLLLAGGQGTRLGLSCPKGMYSVNLPSNKTLYQIQAERLIRIKELANQRFSAEQQQQQQHQPQSITWYIMTSEHTGESTEEFFSQNDYFGLNRENVVFFEQYMLPCLTMDGKIILDQKHKISRASDGNGGLYKALLRRHILEDMQRRGIKYVHVYGVDNILVRVADPVFIGFCLDKQADCAAKAVKKVDPEEKVGVICRVNDRYQVVEYSEISKTARNLRDANGDLTYNAGSICNHFFTYSFLNDLCVNHEKNLKHHIAEKKIPFVDDIGMRQSPSDINGIKLEKFVFDVFPFSSNFAIWEVKRSEEFSPLKNSDLVKSENPTTCRQDIYAECTRWLENAGAEFVYNSEEDKNDKNAICEISPLVSYCGEGLEAFVNGVVLKKPLYIEFDSESETVKFNGHEIERYRLLHKN